MMSRLPALPRPAFAALATVVAMTLAACSTTDTSPTPVVAASASAAATPSGMPQPTPTPSPTPEPTPRYENTEDTELAALIPTSAAGATVVVAPFDQFALTPGDVAVAYGEIGDRFSSLVLAYVEQPRTSLYAMRVDGEPVKTANLKPYLATAGRYVGIAGLDPDPWSSESVDGKRVWTRPEDNATALGTHIYTWSSGEFVFLLIGTDDTVNRAIIEQLPGEKAASRTPPPSASPSTTGGPAESPAATP